MKNYVVGFLVLFAVQPAFALNSCEELKTQIARQLIAKEVYGFELKVGPPESSKGWRIVGNCNHGADRIFYKNGYGRDLIIDIGTGDAIHLKGYGGSFLCNDPLYANVPMDQVLDGAIQLCKATKDSHAK